MPNSRTPVPILRVALFHDNFAQSGGAERVAEALYDALPTADLFSTLTVPSRLPSRLRTARIRNTWMQLLPFKTRLFRAFFLLYPHAVESTNLDFYDLVVTSCFGYAKGVRRRPGALHVCYAHTPMRWVWRSEDYFARERNRGLKTLLLTYPLRWLKTWESRAAQRPDVFLANSQIVADRLQQCFGVQATVIPPPIDTIRFTPAREQESKLPDDDFYLVLSRLVPYKRFDLAVQACVQTGRKLVVLGDGPDRARLQAIAAGHPNIIFRGCVPDDIVTEHAQHCRALIFPGEEDFGMTPLEVNAAGRPVIAFRGGGATETVIDGLNGLFFDAPDAASLTEALDRFEALDQDGAWKPKAIRQHALGFSHAVFHKRLLAFLAGELASHGLPPLPPHFHHTSTTLSPHSHLEATTA